MSTIPMTHAVHGQVSDPEWKLPSRGRVGMFSLIVAESAIFVIFICSVWPMLINTAFGVASVRKEWINVARTLEVGHLRRAFTVILPAAAPTISAAWT